MCKVDSLIEKYDLRVSSPEYDSVGGYLAERWVGADGRSPQGYRTLADWFNERVLEAVYERHDRPSVGIHLDREYDLIRGDDSLDRGELRADLAAYDIDIETVRREMVSGSTMHNHLRNCTDVEKREPASETTSDWQRDTHDVARNLAKSKVASTLSSLSSSGRVPRAAEAEVDVEVKLTCPDCSTRVPFEVALDRGYICPDHSPDAGDASSDAPDEAGSARVDETPETDGGTHRHLSLGIGAVLVLNHVAFLLLHFLTTSSPVSPLDAVAFGAS